MGDVTVRDARWCACITGYLPHACNADRGKACDYTRGQVISSRGDRVHAIVTGIPADRLRALLDAVGDATAEEVREAIRSNRERISREAMRLSREFDYERDTYAEASRLPAMREIEEDINE